MSSGKRRQYSTPVASWEIETGFDLPEYDITHSGFRWGSMAGRRLRQRVILFSSFLAAGLLLGLLSFMAQAQHRAVSIAPVTPHVTVWAWERDEDLSYIDPSKIDVAYFAGNIHARGALVSFRPRTQKLKLPKNVKTIPVFRIETIRGGGGSSAVSSENNEATADLKAAEYVAKTITNRLKKLPHTQMVQIDFDALEDERPFYKSLLKNLRQGLPSETKISMTALASWLLADRWIERGSADEAVAMLFSIGAGKRDVLTRLKKQSLDSGVDVPIAIGISASERETNKSLFSADIQRKTRNLYLFSSRPWTEKRLCDITNEAFGK